MSPQYQTSDYVLVARPMWRRMRLKAGDDVVVRHNVFGTIIKRIKAIHHDRLQLTGLHELSADSDAMGAVPYDAVVGRVVLHVRAPR